MNALLGFWYLSDVHAFICTLVGIAVADLPLQKFIEILLTVFCDIFCEPTYIHLPFINFYATRVLGVIEEFT